MSSPKSSDYHGEQLIYVGRLSLEVGLVIGLSALERAPVVSFSHSSYPVLTNDLFYER